jgi:hypothetical protein
MTARTTEGAADLHGLRDRFDALVDRTELVDQFCSSTDWVLPLHRQLGSGELIVRCEEDAALAVTRLPGRDRRSLLCGLDVMWGYARPVVGPGVGTAVGLVEQLLDQQRRASYGLLLTGSVLHSPFGARLTERLGHRIVAVTEPVGRRVAWLDGGEEAFLARRSPTFRRNARRAVRRVADAGIVVEWCDGGGPELVQRAVAVEHRSWKGRQASGLADPSFARFYVDLAAQLAPSGRMRAGFARRDGLDVGFILGAVRGRTYRGLQLAYDREVAELSLGNVLQLGQIARLAREGVTRYDLGQDMPYKASWSDELFVTKTIVVST